MKIEKSLLSGSTPMLVLSLLKDGDKYGYEMVEELAKRSDDTFQLKEGTLYPILYRLEDDGLITAKWSQGEGRTAPKKYYEVTEEGKREHLRRITVWKAFGECVDSMLQGGKTND